MEALTAGEKGERSRGWYKRGGGGEEESERTPRGDFPEREREVVAAREGDSRRGQRANLRWAERGMGRS